MSPTRSRAVALSAAIATLAVAFVAVPAVTPTPADQPAAAATQICYNPADTRYKNLHTSATPAEVDAGVTAYITGNFTMLTGAQETEGQFVVGGNASFFTHTYSNIGTVGIGSQVSPLPGADVLVTGGNVVVGDGSPPSTTVQVSANSSGNIRAGGTITVGAGDLLEYTSGSGTQGAVTPLAPYATVATDFQVMSSYFAGLADTGTVTVDANTVDFIGDSTSPVQVFSVAGTVLGTIGASKQLNFSQIPVDAIVIVNVTGAAATISTQTLVELNGAGLDWSVDYAIDPSFSHFAQSLAWNFPTATAVTFGDGSQIPGTILAPNASVNLQASTNGRVYVGGDLVIGGGAQTGLEMHNYSFRGFNCSTDGEGSLQISKVLDDTDDIVDDSRVFTGSYSCEDPGGTVVANGTWSVAAGSSQTVDDLPEGAICTITEDPLFDPPLDTDISYIWSAPVISPASVVITDGGTATITATNAYSRATGSLQIEKALDDPDGVVDPARVFTGTYDCGTGFTGSWSVTVTAPQLISGLPYNASCSITEDSLTTPPSLDPSYLWSAPTYSPASVNIGDGTTVTITATNHVTQSTGSLQITKTLIDPDAVVDPLRVFSGTISCDVGTPSPNTWTLAAGGDVTFSGIPEGATCTVTENTLTVGPSSTDSSYVWEAVVYSGNNALITDGGTAQVGVANEVRRALGNLELVKVLVDPFTVVSSGRVYTGTFQCTHNTVDVTPSPGTWSTTAGAAPISLATNLPAGTVCTVAEDALTDPPLAGYPQYQWDAVAYSPVSITIADGVTGRFTVTNTVYDPFDVLAHAGTDAAGTIWLAVGLFGLGAVAVVTGYRRRDA
jgi:choice-of-anchor A domain-containing protein